MWGTSEGKLEAPQEFESSRADNTSISESVTVRIRYSGAVNFITVIQNTIPYRTVLCSTVPYSTVQYSAVLYSAVPYSTVQCSTVEYSAVLYSTVSYSAPDLPYPLL